MPGRSRGPLGDKERLEALVGLKASESLYSIAKRLGVATSTVRRWRDQAMAQGEVFPPAVDKDGAPIGSKKGAWGAPLSQSEVNVHLQRYIGEALEALHVQTRLFADEEWLREQPADDVAVAHGVLFDKVSRLSAGARPGVSANGTGALEPAERGGDPRPLG